MNLFITFKNNKNMFKFTKRSSKKLKRAEPRVKFDETKKNGLFFKDIYIPEELLSMILCFVDHKSLLACQLVCKQWHFIMQDFLWHKKAELTIKKPIPINKSAPWQILYFTCAQTPFGKNLIKNHSGELGPETDWVVESSGGDGWSVECPPEGVPPLPNDPVFEGKEYCFVTSHYETRSMTFERLSCRKYQMVDLVEEGFTGYLLDNFQPKITISEWTCSRWDCAAVYGCYFELYEGKRSRRKKYFESRKSLVCLSGSSQNEWMKSEYVLENYGKGLRRIKFGHGGQDERFWAGHYGCKIAGACITVENPFLNKYNNT